MELRSSMTDASDRNRVDKMGVNSCKRFKIMSAIRESKTQKQVTQSQLMLFHLISSILCAQLEATSSKQSFKKKRFVSSFPSLVSLQTVCDSCSRLVHFRCICPRVTLYFFYFGLRYIIMQHGVRRGEAKEIFLNAVKGLHHAISILQF